MAKILTLTLNPALDLTVRLACLEPGEVNRSEAMITHAAGKGVNVAQVLADLGHQVTVGGFLEVSDIIPIPPDAAGYAQTVVAKAPADPAPFNHPTKIITIRAYRKDGRRA